MQDRAKGGCSDQASMRHTTLDVLDVLDHECLTSRVAALRPVTFD